MSAADVPIERTLFVRKATGLVKGWSVLDAFIYAAFAINLMALGFGYAFTTIAFIPDGAIIAAIVLSALFIIFETMVYASLIAVMPRAGGDYVWQSRILAWQHRLRVRRHRLVVHPLALGADLRQYPRRRGDPADHDHHRQHR